MAWTKDDLDRLDAALLDDTLEVRFVDGRQVKKHSKTEMMSLRNKIADSVNAAGSGRVRTTIGRVVRG
jgi:hypothetical protein